MTERGLLVSEVLAAAENVDVIAPQPGPQEVFLRSTADIAVYGGAAGAGKSYALLLEPLRHVHIRDFAAVMFRRTFPQIIAPGGLWDTSSDIYRKLGAQPRQSSAEWTFPSGARVKFAHMQYESDCYQWDGSQIPLICFDQLEHFTWKQFFYMLSRNRSMCGIRPYMRATCNPDPDHWLRTFMRWWIDAETGLPIKERSGVVLWFVIISDIVYWADSPEELKEAYGSECLPKSFTFVAGTVEDNPVLTRVNPGYLANLNALSNVFRKRLREGNWNARESAGEFFNREWFEIVTAVPFLQDIVRYWDRAATEVAPGAQSTASWTAGVRMGVSAAGVYYVTNMLRFQKGPLGVHTSIMNTASQDSVKIRIGIEGDPGSAGVAEAQHYVRALAGYKVEVNTVHESKGARARPYSAQCQAGNVKLLAGDWNEDFLVEHNNFDNSGKCVADQVDACSGAFHLLTAKKPISETW